MHFQTLNCRCNQDVLSIRRFLCWIIYIYLKIFLTTLKTKHKRFFLLILYCYPKSSTSTVIFVVISRLKKGRVHDCGQCFFKKIFYMTLEWNSDRKSLANVQTILEKGIEQLTKQKSLIKPLFVKTVTRHLCLWTFVVNSQFLIKIIRSFVYIFFLSWMNMIIIVHIIIRIGTAWKPRVLQDHFDTLRVEWLHMYIQWETIKESYMYIIIIIIFFWFFCFLSFCFNFVFLFFCFLFFFLVLFLFVCFLFCLFGFASQLDMEISERSTLSKSQSVQHCRDFRAVETSNASNSLAKITRIIILKFRMIRAFKPSKARSVQRFVSS